MKYDIVLFDVDGTLLDYRKAEKAALISSFEKSNLCLKPECYELFRASSEEARLMLDSEPQNRDIFRVGRFELLFAKLGIQADAEKFNRVFLESLPETPFPLDGAEEVCKKLHELGLNLAIASNGLEWFQRKRLESAGLLPFFSQIFTSEKTGAAKPDRAFFEYAWQELGQPDKTRVLMVGDSFSADIEGALKFGFDACHYKPSKLIKDKMEYHIITKLKKLLPLVQKNKKH